MRARPFWYLRRVRDVVSEDVDEELRVHLEMRVEELTREGLLAEAARREALRRFGDVDATRKYCLRQDVEKERRMERSLFIQDVIGDVRVCLRNLLRAPMVAGSVMVTVGLGIGATTAMFAVVNASLLRPLPYRDAGDLVRIYTDSPPNRWPFSVADYLALQHQQTVFARVAGYVDRPVAFTDGRTAERLLGRGVTWTYFGLLGVRPALGRDFAEPDSRPGSPPAVIVSHGFWQQRLGGRPDAIGLPVRLDGLEHAVIGVLPRDPGPLEEGREFFTALQLATPRRKGPFFITALGRVRSGTDPAAARAELAAINRRIFPIWQASYQDERATWGMVDLKTHVLGDVGRILVLALVAVGLVWVIACANAAHLLVARVSARRQELAVRAALGASRGRVIRYLLADSSLLAGGAALLGIAFAWTALELLQQFAADLVPRAQEIALDGAVLWFLAAATIASAVLFGLIPATSGSAGPINESLRSLGRSTGSPAVRRLRRALVASQFAVATPLLVVAGLLGVSLGALGRVDLGFERRNVVSGIIALPEAQYREAGQVAAFWDEVRQRVERLPGVSALAFADGRPPNEIAMTNNFDLEVFPTPAGQSQPATPWVAVSPDYFRTLGLVLEEGRLFSDVDVRDETPVVVVDRAWARRFFPNGDAVGKRFRDGGCTTCPWTTVVGVVSDVKYAGLDSPDEGTVYTAMERSRRFRYLVLRTTADPASVLPPVREAIRELDPTLPFARVATTDDLVAQSLQMPRYLSLLVGGFALAALVLSIVGIYSVMAYYVQQHSRDISVRLALGGTPAGILNLLVRQGMGIVGSGVVVGLCAAFGLTRLISGLLFGIGATDAVTFAGSALLMMAVALVACLTPAVRAVRLQPAAVLRSE